MKKILVFSILTSYLFADSNIGFLQNQKYVCVNQGMYINKKLEKVMSDEGAFKYPNRVCVDDKNFLNTDAGLKLPLVDKEKQVYKNDNTIISLNVDEKRYMFFMDKAMSFIPAIYICQETDNWTLTK